MPTTTPAPEDFVKVSGGLLLLYGFGTMIGPVIGARADGATCGRKACSWRRRSRMSCSPATRCCASARRAPVPVEDREAFKTLPADRAVTPEALRLDPRSRATEAQSIRVEICAALPHKGGMIAVRRLRRHRRPQPAPSAGRTAARAEDGQRTAAGLPVSRPAVSQHLKVLLDAGLVSAQRRRHAGASTRVSSAGFTEAQSLAGPVLGRLKRCPSGSAAGSGLRRQPAEVTKAIARRHVVPPATWPCAESLSALVRSCVDPSVFPSRP